MNDFPKVKADLIPYSQEYSAIVRSWIDTEETYDLVCRGVNFPPPDDLIDSWQRKGVHSYLLFSENKPVAYGEIWERKAEEAMEVAHLMVDRYLRSRGYGTKLLELLYNRAAQNSGINKVLINLYHQSPEILGCYLKAGFELLGTATHIEGLKMARYVK